MVTVPSDARILALMAVPLDELWVLLEHPPVVLVRVRVVIARPPGA